MSNIPDLYKQSSYSFHLPENLIAIYPCEPRDAARLLVLNRNEKTMKEDIFSNIRNYICPGDTLVVNETKVIPARLYGIKSTGAKAEILLLKQVNEKSWEALVKPARRLKSGACIMFPGSQVKALVTSELPIEGGRTLEFHNCENWDFFLNAFGHIPLPPYINRAENKSDQDSYQTVYARISGSAAAPTAGLHFTRPLLQSIRDQGINVATVLLHVGLGTFRPVSEKDIRKHVMHREYYEINETAADLLNQTRRFGRKVVGVGTTVVRTLETVYDKEKGYCPGRGETDKFIYPGYSFQAIDAMITNFHLPGSTLLMLTSAFGGLDLVKEAYDYAIANQFRFYSYGDAMLLL